MSSHLSHSLGIRNSAGRTNRGVMDIDWIALDMDCIGAKLASLLDCIGLGDFGSRWVRIAFCELRRVPHLHGFDRLGCLG